MTVQTIVTTVRPFINQWLDSCTGRLIYRVMQMLTGHGCFGKYLCHIGKEPTAHCHECGAANDSARHILEKCPGRAEQRRKLVAKIGKDFSL